MYLSLIFLPFFGAFLASNRWNGQKYGPLLSIMNMGFTLLLTQIAFYELSLSDSIVTIELGNWIEYEILKIDWSFTFDTLTISMYIPIIFISFLVQLYSYNYMSNDPHIIRFYSYLSLFTFFMLLLISGDNLLILFLGWEGVGIASYLLINFWYHRLAANFAALKAFLINRLGDWGLMLGILLALGIVNDLSISTLSVLANNLNENILFIILIFFLIGAMAKSAQFGLHSWLADAMEGPTPVSALIHAATMVTAGVYLLMRMSPLLEWSETNQMIIIWLGSISALLGAASGLLENDLKKVIAFSTTSQLGYMVVACGISQYSLSLFHLINHAFFKALLFLSAGAVLHAVMDEQDMRKMGGLSVNLPITYISFIIGSLSLMAFPFLTGFYSKDYLLEILLIPYNFSHSIAYILTLFAAFLTSIYSIRLLILTFQSKPNYSLSIINYIEDPHIFMLIPLLLLNIGAIFFGYLTHELFLGLGSTFYSSSIFIHPNHIRLLDGTFSQFSYLKYIPLTTLLILFTLFPFKKSSHFIRNEGLEGLKLNYMTKILNHFNILQLYTIHNSFNYSINLYRYWDKGLLQILGPSGIGRLIHYISFKLELLSTGFILHYAIIMLSYLIIILILLSISNNVNILYISSLILIYIYLII